MIWVLYLIPEHHRILSYALNILNPTYTLPLKKNNKTFIVQIKFDGNWSVRYQLNSHSESHFQIILSFIGLHFFISPKKITVSVRWKNKYFELIIYVYMLNRMTKLICKINKMGKNGGNIYNVLLRIIWEDIQIIFNCINFNILSFHMY